MVLLEGLGKSPLRAKNAESGQQPRFLNPFGGLPVPRIAALVGSVRRPLVSRLAGRSEGLSVVGIYGPPAGVGAGIGPRGGMGNPIGDPPGAPDPPIPGIMGKLGRCICGIEGVGGSCCLKCLTPSMNIFMACMWSSLPGEKSLIASAMRRKPTPIFIRPIECAPIAGTLCGLIGLPCGGVTGAESPLGGGVAPAPG